MQRKELKKRVRKYAKEVKFYRYGLIAKYLKYLDKKEKELVDAIPNIVCPHCGCTDIELDSCGSEYNSEEWLYCTACDGDFNDEYGYIASINAVDCFSWCDSISARVHFDSDEIDFGSLSWREFCEEEILLTLSNSKWEF